MDVLKLSRKKCHLRVEVRYGRLRVGEVNSYTSAYKLCESETNGLLKMELRQ